MPQVLVTQRIENFERRSYAVGVVVTIADVDAIVWLKSRRLVDDSPSVVSAALAGGALEQFHVRGAPSNRRVLESEDDADTGTPKLSDERSVARAIGNGFLPPTADTLGVNIAIAAAVAVGGGAHVLLPNAPITVVPGIPVVPRSGVSFKLAPRPTLKHTSDIMDKDWSIDKGPVFVGDGTTRAIEHNATDRASPIANFITDALCGVEFCSMGFKNCLDGIKIGARNAAGPQKCKFDDLYFENCVNSSAWIENFAHCEFGDFFMRSSAANASGVECVLAASVATAIWEPGNSKFRGRFFATVNNIRRRGLVLKAYNGGTLNQIAIRDPQVNRFVDTEETYAWAVPASGAPDITVANAALYPVGWPVVPTATFGGLVAGQSYFVTYSLGTTIRLANRPAGPALNITATGTLNAKSSGFFLMEVISEDAGTGSAITNSEFTGLDLEGRASGALLASYGVGNLYSIRQAFTNQYNHICLRNQQRSVVQSTYPCVTDFDSDSNSTAYFGVRADVPAYSWAGWGEWRNPSAATDRGIIVLNATSIGPVYDIKKEQISGVGHFLRSLMPLVTPQGKFVANKNLAWGDSGTTINEGGAGTVNLPAFRAGSLPPAGVPFRVVNAGTGNSTLTIPENLTSGGAGAGVTPTFNRVAAKTTLVLAPGDFAVVETAYTTANEAYWAVTSRGSA